MQLLVLGLVVALLVTRNSMNKSEAIVVCESFRSSVMLSVNTMQINDELKASILIRFQGFYLSTLQDILTAPAPLPNVTP